MSNDPGRPFCDAAATLKVKSLAGVVPPNKFPGIFIVSPTKYPIPGSIVVIVVVELEYVILFAKSSTLTTNPDPVPLTVVGTTEL